MMSKSELKPVETVPSASSSKCVGVYPSKEGLDSKDTKYPDRGKQNSPKIFG